VKTLRHRSEHFSQAHWLCRCQTERPRHPLRIKAQKLAGSGGGTDTPAVPVMCQPIS